jgi:hypothetical protein
MGTRFTAVFVTVVLAGTTIAGAPGPALADQAATVTVDASAGLGALNNPSRYEDQGDYAPLLGPGDLRGVAALDTRVTRIWVKPAQYYDPATKAYDFNYLDVAGDHEQDYLDQADKYSDRILLNVYRCPDALMTPSSTAACRQVLLDGIRHYKQRYPRIEYIEVFNESEANYMPPALSVGDYYTWYKVFYSVVNQLNDELRPQIPLRIGGPATSSISTQTPTPTDSGVRYIKDFLALYSADGDAAKRLDFVSFHSYSLRTHPADAERQKADLDGWIADAGIGTPLRIFVTEYGVFPGAACPGSGCGTTFEADSLTDAAAMSTLGNYYLRGGMDMSFAWTWDHDSNDRKSMFVDAEDGAPYPYYNLVRMQSMLKEGRVASSSSVLSPEGIGVNALATADDSGVSVLTTNYQSTTGTAGFDTTLTVDHLPAVFTGRQIRVEKYLIDATHSNYSHDRTNAGLQLVDSTVLPAARSAGTTFRLGVNAMSLVVLTPVVNGEAETLPTSVSAGADSADLVGADASGAAYSWFDGGAAGDYIQYALPPAAGTFRVLVRMKEASDRARYLVSVNGSDLGGSHDAYLAAGSRYRTTDLGNVTLAPGSASIRFTVIGSTGSGLNLGIDLVQLVPVVPVRVEAEDLTPRVASADPWYFVADPRASGGSLVKVDTTAVGDTAEFTVFVPTAGSYDLLAAVKLADDRGTFRVTVDGVALGSARDTYSAITSIATLPIGTARFDAAGAHSIGFTVVGRNAASSGFSLGLDSLTLTG